MTNLNCNSPSWPISSHYSYLSIHTHSHISLIPPTANHSIQNTKRHDILQSMTLVSNISTHPAHLSHPSLTLRSPNLRLKSIAFQVLKLTRQSRCTLYCYFSVVSTPFEYHLPGWDISEGLCRRPFEEMWFRGRSESTLCESRNAIKVATYQATNPPALVKFVACLRKWCMLPVNSHISQYP